MNEHDRPEFFVSTEGNQLHGYERVPRTTPPLNFLCFAVSFHVFQFPQVREKMHFQVVEEEAPPTRTAEGMQQQQFTRMHSSGGIKTQNMPATGLSNFLLRAPVSLLSPSAFLSGRIAVWALQTGENQDEPRSNRYRVPTRTDGHCFVCDRPRSETRANTPIVVNTSIGGQR